MISHSFPRFHLTSFVSIAHILKNFERPLLAPVQVTRPAVLQGRTWLELDRQPQFRDPGVPVELWRGAFAAARRPEFSQGLPGGMRITKASRGDGTEIGHLQRLAGRQLAVIDIDNIYSLFT